MKTDTVLQEAVKSYQGGNPAAFNTIYESSYQYLHTCVIHIVKDEDTAMDMLQETYLEISKSLGQLQNPEGFLGWAATTANRKCFAYLKKKKDVLLFDSENEDEATNDFFNNIADNEELIPESILQDQEKQRLMKEIIDGLSDMQRLCVIGYYYNEQKQEEIAQELDIPVNTVKSNLSRAKAKIKDAVVELDVKKGTRLYAFTPFFLLFFTKEAKACETKPMSDILAAAVRDNCNAKKPANTQQRKSTLIKIAVGTAAVVVIGTIAVNLNKSKASDMDASQETNTSAQTATDEAAATEANGVIDSSSATEEVQEDTVSAPEEITECFNVLPISGEYDAYMYGNQGLVPVCKNEKWGLVTYDNEVIVPLDYDYTCSIANDDGQTFFGNDDGYSVFDQNGTELFRTENTILSVSEGIVLTKNEEGFYNYYNLDGSILHEGYGEYYMEQEGTDYGYMYQSKGVAFSEGYGILSDEACMYRLDQTGSCTNISGITYAPSPQSESDPDSNVFVNATSDDNFFYTDNPISPLTEGYYVSREQIMEGTADLYYVCSADGSEKYEIRIGDLFDMTDHSIEDDSASWQLNGFFKDGSYRYSYGTILDVRTTTEDGSNYYLLDIAKAADSPSNGVIASKDYIGIGNETYWLFSENDKWGYLDHDGNELATYDDASAFFNGKALVIENGAAYAINDSLEKISEAYPAESVCTYGEIFQLQSDDKIYFITL